MTTQSTKTLTAAASFIILLIMSAPNTLLLACEISSVSLYVGATADDAENNYETTVNIPVGDIACFYATCSVTENPAELGVNWEFDLDGDGTWEYSTSTSYDENGDYLETSTSHTYSTSGTYSAKARACLDDGDDNWATSSTCTVKVIRVQKVVKDGTTDDGPLYVCLNDTVDLEAIPDPGNTFPDDEPTWQITSRPAPENPGDPEPGSLSSSSGTTTTVNNLTVAGDYTVKATCGTSSNSITITAFEGEAAPAIEDAGIERSPDDRVWFHIKDDPLTLTAIGRDGDTGDGSLSYDYVEDDDIYYDYIDLDSTQWSGSGDLSETEGATTTWNPQSPNSAGIIIKATIDDDGDAGYGDDDPVERETPELYAYRVGVDVNQSWTSDDLYADPTTTASSSSTQSFWEDSALESISYTGGLGHYLDADEDEEKLSRQKVIKMRWTLIADPTNAELGVKRIKTVVTATDNEATIHGVVNDWDNNDGTSSISIGISGGGGGFSAKVATTITWGSDENDGFATAGWAFSGDEFSDLVDNDTQKYSMVSSDYPESQLPKTAAASGSVNQTKPFVGLHNTEFKSKYEVEGRTSFIGSVYLHGCGIAESLRTGTYVTERPFLFTPPVP